MHVFKRGLYDEQMKLLARCGYERVELVKGSNVNVMKLTLSVQNNDKFAKRAFSVILNQAKRNKREWERKSDLEAVVS